jgi:glucan biosynthesis protein
MDRFSSLSNGRRERESTATSSRVGGCFSYRYPAACSGGRGGHDPSLQPLLVRELARTLATKPFEPPDEKLPDALTNLNYDQYRSIRFAPEKALWRDEKLPFEVQFFHRGFFYKNRVNIFQVVNRSVMPVPYRREDFSFGEGLGQWPDGNIGFAGFRIHAPIDRPDYYDEVGVFLGASYFRAVAKGQTYGLSARGLAIDTGESKGEEFPFFKAFWLEKPAPNASSIVVHALLDSKGAAASYRFTIRPGQTTVFDVEMALYPRDVEHAGLAPMTSMFFFGPNEPQGFRRLPPCGSRFRRTCDLQRERRAALASAQQSARSAGEQFRRPQTGGLRPDAAGEEFRRLSGSRIQLRTAPKPLVRADRAIGAKGP